MFLGSQKLYLCLFVYGLGRNYAQLLYSRTSKKTDPVFDFMDLCGSKCHSNLKALCSTGAIDLTSKGECVCLKDSQEMQKRQFVRSYLLERPVVFQHPCGVHKRRYISFDQPQPGCRNLEVFHLCETSLPFDQLLRLTPQLSVGETDTVQKSKKEALSK